MLTATASDQQHFSLLRVPEACGRLRCSRRKLYTLLAAGLIESIKVGRARLVVAESVDAYIARLRSTPSSIPDGDEKVPPAPPSSLDALVARLIADAPALTAEQRARLRVLVAP